MKKLILSLALMALTFAPSAVFAKDKKAKATPKVYKVTLSGMT
ncbi:MAG: hypothetical protein P1V97_09460 [Planctomycetota bacterium]|nr:hypothetical protein [Planctomycetota bacterium]